MAEERSITFAPDLTSSQETSPRDYLRRWKVWNDLLLSDSIPTLPAPTEKLKYLASLWEAFCAWKRLVLPDTEPRLPGRYTLLFVAVLTNRNAVPDAFYPPGSGRALIFKETFISTWQSKSEKGLEVLRIGLSLLFRAAQLAIFKILEEKRLDKVPTLLRHLHVLNNHIQRLFQTPSAPRGATASQNAICPIDVTFHAKFYLSLVQEAEEIIVTERHEMESDDGYDTPEGRITSAEEHAVTEILNVVNDRQGVENCLKEFGAWGDERSIAGRFAKLLLHFERISERTESERSLVGKWNDLWIMVSVLYLVVNPTTQSFWNELGRPSEFHQSFRRTMLEKLSPRARSDQ